MRMAVRLGFGDMLSAGPGVCVVKGWSEFSLTPPRLTPKSGSRQHFEPMLLDHSQQLERHPAGPLDAGLPLLYRGLAGV